MKTINYNNPSILYAGRWTDFGSSKGSAWQGSQIRFRVKNSLNLSFTVEVQDNNSSDLNLVVVNINNGPPQILTATTASEIFTGTRTVSITLPNLSTQNIIVKLAGLPPSQWTGNSYCRLKSISIDDNGEILSWGAQAPQKIAFVGDSWMAIQNDWPHLLGSDNFFVYPISFGGAKVSDLDSQFNFDRSGVLNQSDIPVDAVIVNSSVNDLIAGVSVSSFQTSLQSLVNKIRNKNPMAPIILIQSPRNVSAGLNYDQYGPAMQAVATATSNVFYIPIPSSDWSLFAWDADTAHLTFAGLQAFANYLKPKIEAIIPPVVYLKVKTAINTLNIPAYKADSPAALYTPVFKTSQGEFLRLKPVQINTELVGQVLIKLSDGLTYKLSS